MGHITLSLFAAICFANAAYGGLSSSSSDDRHPDCPRLFDSKNSIYRCETDGSFWCCDEEKFALQGKKDTGNIRSRRSYPYDSSDSLHTYVRTKTSTSYSMGTGGMVGIISSVIFIVCLCCCCCCYCACCPWYHMYDRNNSNVTIVQAPGYPAASNSQNNFCINVPNQPAATQQSYAPMQQPPPPYIQEKGTYQPATGGIM